MANSSKYDVMLDLYRKSASSMLLAPELISETPSVEAKLKLLENHRLNAHLIYEVIESVKSLNIDELKSELECRNIEFVKFGQKVARNLNNAVRTILFYALFEDYGISMQKISESMELLMLESKILFGTPVLSGAMVETAVPVTIQQNLELSPKLKLVDEIDMAKENITASQQEVLDRSHSKFMAENVNPFISSAHLNEEDVVRLMSLSK